MKKLGRNDPCPCGSGKKFKRCCLSNHTHNAIQALPANNTINSNRTLKCEAPGCDIAIPINLKYGHEQQYLCGATICPSQNQPKWALCPQHAREWIKEGHGCKDLQHYRLWKTSVNLTSIIDTTPIT